MAFESPFEMLEMADGEIVELRIVRWELGEATIVPVGRPEGKLVRLLRVHLADGTKAFFPFWWDITPTTLIAQLVPWLEQPGFERRRFVITKHGEAPKARYALRVEPATPHQGRDQTAYG